MVRVMEKAGKTATRATLRESPHGPPQTAADLVARAEGRVEVAPEVDAQVVGEAGPVPVATEEADPAVEAETEAAALKVLREEVRSPH